jgi:branched-chain amino acid transport system ATP-binding protein
LIVAEREPLLEVDEMTMHFGGITALSGVSVALQEGAITSLVGPNGSGKTTLLNCLTGFARPASGTVRFRGRDISRTSRRQRILSGIRRTFQAAHVFQGLTILDHLLLAQQEFDNASWFDEFVRSRRLRRATTAAKQDAREALSLVELHRPVDALASDLSYGQQKLLGLACGLVGSPALLCLDEPLAGVNPALADRLVSVLEKANGRGTTLLIVEHNIDFVSMISDHVVVLAEGEVVVAGPPSELRDDPKAFEALSGLAEPA